MAITLTDRKPKIHCKKNITIKAAVVSAVMLASAGAAFALSANTTAQVNVRSGPGTDYGVVDFIRRGEHVDIVECETGWCYVQKRGPDGWVSSSYLALLGTGYEGAYSGSAYDVSHSITLEFNFSTAPIPRQPQPHHGGWHDGRNGDGWQNDFGGRDGDYGQWGQEDRWVEDYRDSRGWN